MNQFKPLKFDPEWDVEHWFPSIFLSKGFTILVRHLGQRKFEVVQNYKIGTKKNLWVAFVESITKTPSGYTIKSNCGEIELMESHFFHYVFTLSKG